jgi:SEC-C motif-containing protein
MKSCICGKSKPFAKCCDRFISGKHNAKTPEQLMRSRFSAYALGGFGKYLISTWLPASSKGLSVSELSEKTVNWQRLKIVSSSQQGNNGVVEFNAWFYKSTSSDEMEIMHEISEFVRIQSRWFYVGGIVK